jgi:hypothetical protein
MSNKATIKHIDKQIVNEALNALEHALKNTMRAIQAFDARLKKVEKFLRLDQLNKEES